MPIYIVRLTETERHQLEQMLAKGRHAAAAATRARILLNEAGPGWQDGEIVCALDTSPSTVHRVRQDFVEQGLDAALSRRKPAGRQHRKLDGAQEARLAALACGPAPEGHARWTLKLLAQRMVELAVVDSIGPECVRTTPKKTNSSPGWGSNGSSRPRPTPRSCARWRRCWKSARGLAPPAGRKSASTNAAGNWSPKPASPCPPNPGGQSATTTKHGSWLDMAEIELGVLATQCLDRRIGDMETLTREVAAWQARRNTAGCTVDWRFTTADARIKLKRLYPSIQLG